MPYTFQTTKPLSILPKALSIVADTRTRETLGYTISNFLADDGSNTDNAETPKINA